MGKLTNKELNRLDLEAMASSLRKFSDEIIKVKVLAKKVDIQKICDDLYGEASTKVMYGAYVSIFGIDFHLIVSDKN